jgi:hypothetical protein
MGQRHESRAPWLSLARKDVEGSTPSVGGGVTFVAGRDAAHALGFGNDDLPSFVPYAQRAFESLIQLTPACRRLSVVIPSGFV